VLISRNTPDDFEPHVVREIDCGIVNAVCTTEEHGISAGMWKTGPFRLESYVPARGEVLHIVSGELKVHHSDGTTVTLSGGDTAFFPPVEMTWEVSEELAAFFVIAPSSEPGQPQ
jgi:uncharacterized cupin superfamily protein